MRKYLRAAQTSLTNALTYKSNLISRFAFYALFITIFFNLWRFIYQDGEVAGYTLERIVWYLCFSELIVFSARAQALGGISEDIKTGAIAYQLGRPYDFTLYHFAASAGEMALNFVCFGALAVVMGLLTAGPIDAYNWLGVPIGLLSAVLGIGMNYFLYLCATLSALWIEDSFGVTLILQKLIFLLGVFMPVEFLPGWLQGIARLLPFSYIAWAPSKLFVDFSWDLLIQTLPVQMIWLGVFFMLSRFIFTRGMKALEAHGG